MIHITRYNNKIQHTKKKSWKLAFYNLYNEIESSHLVITLFITKILKFEFIFPTEMFEIERLDAR